MDDYDPLIGMKIGQVEIKEYLDEGAMGVVYKGYHGFLQKKVAVKFMASSLMRSKRFEYIYRYLER